MDFFGFGFERWSARPWNYYRERIIKIRFILFNLKFEEN